MTNPPLSVIAPLYKCRDTVRELLERLADVCPHGTEVILVDDACPEHSGNEALAGSHCIGGQVVFLSRNVGQHAAVLIGLQAARGTLVAVMDADLQDAPEDLPLLVDRLEAWQAQGIGAVTAARHGHYERRGRQWTGRLYRGIAHKLTRGRIPPAAGMFAVMTSSARDSAQALKDPLAPLIPALAAAGVQIAAVQVTRHHRTNGSSSYRPLARMSVAARGLLLCTPLRKLSRKLNQRLWKAPETRTVDFGLAAQAKVTT